jgi:uncharacterized protein (DUF1800 family)
MQVHTYDPMTADASVTTTHFPSTSDGRVASALAAQTHATPVLPAGVAALASASLAACGGGTDGNANFTSGSDAVKTEAEAARFLARADLSVTEESIKNVRAVGRQQWLKEQIAMKTDISHQQWLIQNGKHIDDGNHSNSILGGGWHQALWWKLFTSPNGVRQKMVLAWSELFVVSCLGLTGRWKNFAIASYLDTLEKHAFGNFRDLLEAVTLHPAMGNYLNMAGSQKADKTTGRVPDENYAREVMQLFTIGLYKLLPAGGIVMDKNGQPQETYTNQDVQGLAKVFTGWNKTRTTVPTEGFWKDLQQAAYANTQPMVLNSELHSPEDKSFLNTFIPANHDGADSLNIALNALFEHQNTPRFIAKYLIQRFVTSNPTRPYIERVASVFEDNGTGVRGDMAAVITAILCDPDSNSSPNANSVRMPEQFGKLREPVARLLQWGRTFGASSAQGETNQQWNFFTHKDTDLAQMPMMSPSVFNFFRPGYIPRKRSLHA